MHVHQHVFRDTNTCAQVTLDMFLKSSDATITGTCRYAEQKRIRMTKTANEDMGGNNHTRISAKDARALTGSARSAQSKTTRTGQYV
jgi:hypothetical protein